MSLIDWSLTLTESIKQMFGSLTGMTWCMGATSGTGTAYPSGAP